ncbi:unnamed protein product [Heligmosomoides polygyrus]|uniref:Secreted protein n=1 Tax=Heligmosomoides polygyrus TaxID=6339 RepID=A0A183FAV2_HELPZ|nr:unnamed protein product [Heligmosomoides polygyrus]
MWAGVFSSADDVVGPAWGIRKNGKASSKIFSRRANNVVQTALGFRNCAEDVLECVQGFGKRAETSQNVRRDGEGVPMTSTKNH